MLEFHVIGRPTPQGSKSFKGMRTSKKTGKAVPVLEESSGEHLRNWRAAVAWSADAAIRKACMRYPNKPAIEGCVEVYIVFSMLRPKSAKPGAWPGTMPDIDKLERSTFDGLTDARLWEDDARVVKVTKRKVYVGDVERGAMVVPGAFIRVERIK